MAQKKSTIASQGLSFRKCFRFEVNPAAAVEPLWCAPWTPTCYVSVLFTVLLLLPLFLLV